MFQKYRKLHDDNEVAGTIYKATQRTYKEVERRMSENLRDRMPLLELEYYKEMAAGTPFDLSDKTNPDLKTKDETDFMAALKKVPGVARTHNKDAMLQLGWKLDG